MGHSVPSSIKCFYSRHVHPRILFRPAGEVNLDLPMLKPKQIPSFRGSDLYRRSLTSGYCYLLLCITTNAKYVYITLVILIYSCRQLEVPYRTVFYFIKHPVVRFKKVSSVASFCANGLGFKEVSWHPLAKQRKLRNEHKRQHHRITTEYIKCLGRGIAFFWQMLVCPKFIVTVSVFSKPDSLRRFDLFRWTFLMQPVTWPHHAQPTSFRQSNHLAISPGIP